ncbi:MAG: arylsulfatase A-like enzyme, partial [Candidatus Azotimanducaceae bacterium]
DLELQRLLAHIDQRMLWSKTTLIIVSDHGMTPVTESVEVKSALEDAGLNVRVTGGDAAQHLFLESAADRDEVRKTLANQPNIQIFEGEDIPAPLAAPNRTGDIVVTTQPPYSLRRAESFIDQIGVFLSPLLGWSRGAHGYDPTIEDMGGIFFALGNGVTKGKKIAAVHQLEVAPTVARLLGIEPPRDAKRPGISLD